MYISTINEGQDGRREATNETGLGLKIQSQFCRSNLSAKKADVEQCSQSGYKAKPVQNELALHQQTQPTSNNSKGNQWNHKGPLPYTGKHWKESRKGQYAPIPACLRDTKGLYMCGFCVLLANCLNFPVVNHRRGNEFQGNKH